MHRLKSRIIREWDFNHKGWLLEAARFLAPQLLALTLWDESERKPLLAIWPTEADSPACCWISPNLRGIPRSVSGINNSPWWMKPGSGSGIR